MSTKPYLALALLALCLHLGAALAAGDDKATQMRIAAQAGDTADRGAPAR